MDQPIPPADPDLDAFLGTKRRSRGARIAKRVAIVVAIVVVLLLIGRCAFGRKAPPAYAMQPVRRGDLAVTVSATGNLTPTVQVNVGSEESGLVTNVFVQNNDRVTKGEPLARLDTSRLQDALVQSQAALRAAAATVAQDRATLDQSRATLSRYQEVSRLSGGKVPSKTEMDTARADYERAEANLQAARAQVAQQQALLATNRTNLAKASIYSPVDGVVLSRQVEPGQTVAASFNVPTLFSIAKNLTSMKLEVKVDEADVGEVRVGDPASFTVDAYPGRRFPARVTRIDLGANATPSVNSAGATQNSTSTVVAYTAVLAVANPDLALRPGMTATADILTDVRRNVLLVPNAALRFTPAGDWSGSGGGMKLQFGPPSTGPQKEATIGRGSVRLVYTLGADGKPRPIRVTVGATNGNLTEVSSPDLRPGMKIITGKLAGPSARAGQ